MFEEPDKHAADRASKPFYPVLSTSAVEYYRDKMLYLDAGPDKQPAPALADSEIGKN